MFLLDMSKENSKGKPHTDYTDSIIFMLRDWEGGCRLYSLYVIPSFSVYCSRASFNSLLIFTWRKSWFRFINTRPRRNMFQQLADWIYRREKIVHHDLVRYIMELFTNQMLITAGVLCILQYTCTRKYQEPRTPHPHQR